MKVKSLVLSGAAAVIIPVAGMAAPVFADSPAQIGGGDIYRVANLTQKTDFADTTNANACDELEYKVRLHNSSYGKATNIVAAATLSGTASTTNTSKMTINYTTNGPTDNVSDTATVNLTSAQSISYESGTTQLLDANNNVVKSLPDGVTAGGVNIGDLNGSTVEFVQFKAKVNCPTTPPVTPPTTTTTTTTSTPTTLVNTGAGSVAGIFAAAVAFGAVAYRVVLSRRLSRQ
ncbi:MAG TPA: hypothetical protein VHC21_01745 [Candidatus Saccharimonadales bacterium]|nr:hypothetical protein [Candidatus Saccharimonadales bacterium]